MVIDPNIVSESEVDTASDFDSFYRHQYPQIFREVCWIVYDRTTAAEIVQEAFYRALVRWHKVSKYDKPGAWVRTVALRLANKALMRRKLQTCFTPVDTASLDHERSNTIFEMREAIHKLSVAQRTIVLLYYFLGYETTEIARILKKSDGGIRTSLTRAREQLRVILQQ